MDKPLFLIAQQGYFYVLFSVLHLTQNYLISLYILISLNKKIKLINILNP